MFCRYLLYNESAILSSACIGFLTKYVRLRGAAQGPRPIRAIAPRKKKKHLLSQMLF